MNPSISIIIPTYNSTKTLKDCLESIKNQNYSGKVEVIIVDAGSTDGTCEISRKYTHKIYPNPLKTGEAGKAVGLKHAQGEIIALIDSDNILPERDWLRRMVAPFSDPDIVGTEPLYYTHRLQDGYITRYCALMGMNDPLCLFVGNYDRMNLITGRWTGMPVQQEDMGDYFKVELNKKKIPTIGANGFLVRQALFERRPIGDYLFDIDLVYELVTQGYKRFAKVKTGIIHIFSGSLYTFIKKQQRRIRDHYYYVKKGARRYSWYVISKAKLLKFILYTITVFPLMSQLLRGYRRKQDRAWWFHIPACWITLMVYTFVVIENIFSSKLEDRINWQK